MPTRLDRKRLVVLALFTFFLFSALIAQFYKIQIIEGDKWSKAADRQHQLVIVETGKRGVFYANSSIKKGHPESPQPLVVDIPKFHLYADPKAIPEAFRAEVAACLEPLLGGEKVLSELGKKSRSRKLVAWLDGATREKIEKWWHPYARQKKIARNALFFIQDYQRSYPYGKMLGQVLHTLRDDKDPETGQGIPTGGLELVFNRLLQGKDGKRVILRSPRHPLDTGTVVTAPENGADIYLTINPYIQSIAEEEIAKAVERANAKAGWAVMMDPETGEILAFAQAPFFEPGDYRKYFNDPQLTEQTKVKALTDPFEPGSTMKPITLAVALAANAELKKRGKPPLFSPHEKVATGIAHFPGRGKPLKDLHTTRFLNMYMGLQHSSNVYMAKMVQRVIEQLGENWYRSVLHDLFGFGQKTGIELPSESAGLLPTPGKKYASGRLEWSKATPYSMAMGHNILVNSIQMLRAYGVLASGGYLVQPTLIRKVIRGGVEFPIKRIEKKRVLEKEIVAEIVRAMKFVTKPGGSARRADIPGYTEAGKTGTSEKIVGGVYSKKNHISTFLGFAPAKNPRFVLLVSVDEPESKYIPGVGKNQLGGVCCAPAFREISLRTLQYLGVPPDDPDNTDWKLEVEQIKKTYEQWNH